MSFEITGYEESDDGVNWTPVPKGAKPKKEQVRGVIYEFCPEHLAPFDVTGAGYVEGVKRSFLRCGHVVGSDGSVAIW